MTDGTEKLSVSIAARIPRTVGLLHPTASTHRNSPVEATRGTSMAKITLLTERFGCIRGTRHEENNDEHRDDIDRCVELGLRI